MDSGVLSHFDHRGYDVVMVSCYHQEISQKETVNIDDYDKVYLVAWSMGVYFALDFMHANANKIPTRLLDEQIEELKYIKDRCVPKVFTHTFDKIFVGQNDRIILSENQNKAWENHPFVIKNDCPHFPFYQLNNWSEILKDE